MSDIMARTAKAIHTLFYATKVAHERYVALENSLTTDEEHAALQAFSIGLINFDPLPPKAAAGLRARAGEIERQEAGRPKQPSERIAIESHDSEEGRYVKRLLRLMYTNWQGTLDYERGVHSFCFYSPFDEEGRRHSVSAYVAVDGVETERRVRRYVLGPYLRVIDLRTKRESDDPWRVLGGDLTPILPEPVIGDS